jgi:hypothetical protein
MTMAISTGCHKLQSSVEGDIYYQSSNSKVDRANIYIVEEHNGNSEQFIGQTTTDENGHFKIYYYAHIFKSYKQYIRVKKDSLYCKQQLKDKHAKATIYL